MKTFAIIVSISYFATAIYGFVLAPEGYHLVSIVFTGYSCKPRNFVERQLAKQLPNVQFKIYTTENYYIYTEEFYFGSIRLVVNDKDVVFLPPKFSGFEPDLKFAAKLVGKKDYMEAVQEIQSLIPTARIIVRKGKNIIWKSTNENLDYILVEVSPKDSTVTAIPKFVRVPKTPSHIFV